MMKPNKVFRTDGVQGSEREGGRGRKQTNKQAANRLATTITTSKIRHLCTGFDFGGQSRMHPYTCRANDCYLFILLPRSSCLSRFRTVAPTLLVLKHLHSAMPKGHSAI